MTLRIWFGPATALVMAACIGCAAPEEDAEDGGDTEATPAMLDACREACAEFAQAECNPAAEVEVCEASCEQSDVELVEGFIDCVDEDVCGECVQVWCSNGCA